jgi:hypothetical protein
MARRIGWLAACVWLGAIGASCVKGGGGEAREDVAQPAPTVPAELDDESPTPPIDEEQPVADQIPSSGPSAFVVTSSDGLPADLVGVAPLWESARHPTQRRAESVARLYPDGRAYRYGDTRRTGVNGRPGQERAPKAWRLEAKVSPAGIAKVEELIRTTFVALAANPPPAVADSHGRLYTWRAHLGGSHVVITPAAAMDRLPPAIVAIEHAIQAGIIPGAVPLEQPKP